MKVIAGKYRWKKICTSLKGLDSNFRPTKSIVREAVFNIMNNYELANEFKLDGSNVLDAFCGSGAYGIEALSRGASSIHFINKNRMHLELVKHNIGLLGTDNLDVEYIVADATRLRALPRIFNLIFIDPPYNTQLHMRCLESISENLELAKQNLIFIELHIRQVFVPPKSFDCLTKKVYGSTKIYVLRKKI